jgi:putative membrane protein
MWGYHHDMSAWAWWLMSGGMVVFWAVVAWVIVTLVRDAGARPRGRPDDILAERFARGEIDEETYRRQRELVRR